jgi:hypothetical protein
MHEDENKLTGRDKMIKIIQRMSSGCSKGCGVGGLHSAADVIAAADASDLTGMRYSSEYVMRGKSCQLLRWYSTPA